jgi:hypothetical protein
VLSTVVFGSSSTSGTALFSYATSEVSRASHDLLLQGRGLLSCERLAPGAKYS